MISHKVARSKIQVKVLEILQDSGAAARVRVAIVDPKGAVHFAVIEFLFSPSGNVESWNVVDQHAIQLPLGVAS